MDLVRLLTSTLKFTVLQTGLVRLLIFKLEHHQIKQMDFARLLISKQPFTILANGLRPFAYYATELCQFWQTDFVRLLILKLKPKRFSKRTSSVCLFRH